MEADAYDVAIIGAGPNGLTAAAYLARRGLRVLLLERRFERGGTFATDDYSTPFQYNLAQFELPFGEELPPFRELDLEAEGVRFVEPELAFSARAEPDAEELVVGRGGRGLGDGLEAMLVAASEAVTPLLYRPPRPEAELRDQLRGGDLGGALALAEATPSALAARASDPRAGIVLRYACGLAGFLEPDEPLGLIGALSVARRFTPSLVAGGTKNLANALYRVAVRAGARAYVSSEVTAVERAAQGFLLRTAIGSEHRARAVVSTLDPAATFLGLLDEGETPDELRAAARGWRIERAVPFTAHFGIRGEAPAPAAGDADALIRVFGFMDAADVGERFDAAADGELAADVAGHLSVVSAHDALQASAGPLGPLHTLRVQTIAPSDPRGAGWDADRAARRAACWDAVRWRFPALGDARLLFQFCDSPLDIERRFATTRGGSLRQGALVPAQTFTARPHPSCAGCRTPVEGLYLGGGAVHPGVPGSLAAGVNAAVAVAEDLGA